MIFDICQLDSLTYDEVEPLLDDYIEGAMEQFVNAVEGQAYLDAHPKGLGWIGEFIHLGYVYEGFTLPKMTKGDVQLLMETIFPRKITIFDPSEAEDAIPELIAFWQFIKREYGFRSANAIVKYLETLKPRFPELMCDPARGGIAKAFMLLGNQAGFDMTTQEGIQAFQQHYNASLQADTPDPIMNSLKALIQGTASSSSASPSKPSGQSKAQPQGMWVKETRSKTTKKSTRKKK
jgi:hypothetical protein